MALCEKHRGNIDNSWRFLFRYLEYNTENWKRYKMTK